MSDINIGGIASQESIPAGIAATKNIPAGGPLARIWTALVPMWEPLALCTVLVLAFALRQALMGVRPLWLDEAYSLDVARKSLYKMWVFLRTNDSHPIGYYALLSLFIRWFGTGLAAMRSSSVLFGFLAVLLTWRIGRGFFSPAIGILAAVYVALNPFQIMASNEIRMYPLLECLVLSSTWIVWRAVQSPPRRWWWVLYGISVAAMLYTSYYAFLIVAAQALWILLSRPRNQAARNILIAGTVAVVLYAPWFPHLLAAMGRVALPWRQPLTLNLLSSVYASQTFGAYLFNIGTYFDVGTLAVGYRALMLAPFAALMVAGWVALGRVSKPARSLVGLSWTVPLLLLIVASLAAGRAAAFPRHLVFLQPFAGVLLASGIMSLRKLAPATLGAVAPAAAALFTLMFVFPAVYNVQANPHYQYYRYDALAGYVATHYKKGDAVVYFPAATSLPFRYYFTPPGRQVFITLKHEWSRSAYRGTGGHVAAALAQRKVERVWLVFSEPLPPGSVSEVVGAFRAKHYTHGAVKDFRLVGLMLLTHPHFTK
jgi:uncharacterized membrane protein